MEIRNYGLQKNTAIEPSQPTPQEIPQNIIASCGSIKWVNIMNAGVRTSSEADALNCMVQALTSCNSESLAVDRIQDSTYQIENKENQYCNISRNAGLKTTCKIPLSYISDQRQKYKSPSADDIFLMTIIASIDNSGKTVNARTGAVTTEFVCE
jgi:hypothetical protein